MKKTVTTNARCNCCGYKWTGTWTKGQREKWRSVREDQLTNIEQATDELWTLLERYLDPPEGYEAPCPGYDRGAFNVNVRSILVRFSRRAVSNTLDHALNSGDGVYRP